jgi:hypothetical protein
MRTIDTGALNIGVARAVLHRAFSARPALAFACRRAQFVLIYSHPMSDPEVWLRGPVPGYDPMVLPVVHSLLQVREDLTRLEAMVAPAQVWTRPGAPRRSASTSGTPAARWIGSSPTPAVTR